MVRLSRNTCVNIAKSPLLYPFVLYWLVTFAIQLLEVPVLRLFETAICKRYYRSLGNLPSSAFNDIDETSCKIPVVQNELAYVIGWKLSLDAVPGD